MPPTMCHTHTNTIVRTPQKYNRWDKKKLNICIAFLTFVTVIKMHSFYSVALLEIRKVKNY